MTAEVIQLPSGGDATPPSDTLSLVRLLRLASPALPVGAFAYSQGLETAISEGWVHDETSIGDWICDVLEFNIARFEAPVLHRLMLAWSAHDLEEVRRLNDWFLAARETSEFRAETAQMGYALRQLFDGTGEFAPEEVDALHRMEAVAFPTAFAFAAARWEICRAAAVSAYLFAWSENQVNGAMKAFRLGHMGAQRILGRVSGLLTRLKTTSSHFEIEETSNFTPALAIASCLHEPRDARVFRS